MANEQKEKSVVVLNRGMRSFVVVGKRQIRPGDNKLPQSIAKDICAKYPNELRIVSA